MARPCFRQTGGSGSVMEPDRPNRANPPEVICGWENILNVLTMTDGDHLVIH
jgi:hypothetical protein